MFISIRKHSFLVGVIFALASHTVAGGAVLAAPLSAAQMADPPLFPGLSYADTADLALRAPVIALVRVTKAERLKGELAPDLSAGSSRFLISANVESLLHGADGLAGTVTYIVDVPLDSRGKAPNLKNRRFIVLAESVPARPQEIRLVSAHGQLDWSIATESRVRSILTEASAATVPPRVTGVGRAFHVPGAVAGESETQIFLTTADGRPVSLNVLRRPDEQPHWAVALAEIVDDAAAPPAPDTLLWYRLACFLPPHLPDTTVSGMDADSATAAAQDYDVVLAGLGTCVRTLPQ
jgi:hypothetical protein